MSITCSQPHLPFVSSCLCLCLCVSVSELCQIHWFSIFNSFMMVIFLVGLVTMILMRTLRKDFVRYSKDSELDDIVRFETIRGREGCACVLLFVCFVCL